jgi:hypothetical protein
LYYFANTFSDYLPLLAFSYNIIYFILTYIVPMAAMGICYGQVTYLINVFLYVIHAPDKYASFQTLQPRPNVIMFYSRNLQNLGLCWSVCPCQVFASKVKAYPSEASFKCFTLVKAPGLNHKQQTRLESLTKHITNIYKLRL